MKSDKEYWHRYLDFYWKYCFKYCTGASHILEWGVGQGASAQYLLDHFKEAKLDTCDIMPLQEAWPVNRRVYYHKVDQSQRMQVREFFKNEVKSDFDLIIDDGSHKASDQANCLLEGFPYLRPQGFYILEDLQTNIKDVGAPLQLLLAIEHYRSTEGKFDYAFFQSSYFHLDELEYLDKSIRQVDIFRRATLPMMCYMCKSDQYYDFKKMECGVCHIPLYSLDDSITAIILKNK